MKIDISTQTLFKFYIHILNTIFHYIDDKSFANYPQNIPRYSKLQLQLHPNTIESSTSIHNRWIVQKNGRWTNQTHALSINFIFATGIPHKRSSSECADPLCVDLKKKKKEEEKKKRSLLEERIDTDLGCKKHRFQR